MIGEILADVLPMLTAGTPALDLPAPVHTDEPHVQVERPRDNPDFADLSRGSSRRCIRSRPAASAPSRPSLQARGATQQEWRRFHRGVAVDPGSKEARHCLKQLAQSGRRSTALTLTKPSQSSDA